MTLKEIRSLTLEECENHVGKPHLITKPLREYSYGYGTLLDLDFGAGERLSMAQRAVAHHQLNEELDTWCNQKKDVGAGGKFWNELIGEDEYPSMNFRRSHNWTQEELAWFECGMEYQLTLLQKENVGERKPCAHCGGEVCMSSGEGFIEAWLTCLQCGIMSSIELVGDPEVLTKAHNLRVKYNQTRDQNNDVL